MLFAATGNVSRPLFKLAQLLASCPTWRNVCGGVSAADAFARIQWTEADDRPSDDDATRPADSRPRAIVDLQQNLQIGIGDAGSRSWNGSLLLSLELPVFATTGLWPENYWPADYWLSDYWPATAVPFADRWVAAANKIGAILYEMQALVNTSPGAGHYPDAGRSFMDLNRIEEVLPPTSCDPTVYDGELFVGAIYRFTWGFGSR